MNRESVTGTVDFIFFNEEKEVERMPQMLTFFFTVCGDINFGGFRANYTYVGYIKIDNF